MFNEINSNLSLIFYRYKWQLLINKVNQEYHKEFVWDVDCVVTRNKYKDAIYDDEECYQHVLFNCRNLDQRNWLLRYGDDEVMTMNVGTHTQHIYWEMGLDHVNYVYTSTKYLQEIKKSGIRCLSIDDNV